MSELVEFLKELELGESVDLGGLLYQLEHTFPEGDGVGLQSAHLLGIHLLDDVSAAHLTGPKLFYLGVHLSENLVFGWDRRHLRKRESAAN